MTEIQNPKPYDLEDRTFAFAQNVRYFIKDLSKSIINLDDIKQLIRSSGSVGANYIEANEALSKKDFLMRIKICRKEAKETIYWLKLLEVSDNNLMNLKIKLINEVTELMKIFGSIIEKVK